MDRYSTGVPTRKTPDLIIVKSHVPKGTSILYIVADAIVRKVPKSDEPPDTKKGMCSIRVNTKTGDTFPTGVVNTNNGTILHTVNNEYSYLSGISIAVHNGNGGIGKMPH